MERIFAMPVSRVYPLYVDKVERKGRTVEELHQVISWLTGHVVALLAMLLVYAGLIAGTVWLAHVTPAGFIPEQDQGVLIGVVQLPAGASLDRTTAVMNRAVAEAWTLATADDPRPDAVLLAPAAASLDMFPGYGRRGDAFAAAARSLPGSAPRATQP